MGDGGRKDLNRGSAIECHETWLVKGLQPCLGMAWVFRVKAVNTAVGSHISRPSPPLPSYWPQVAVTSVRELNTVTRLLLLGFLMVGSIPAESTVYSLTRSPIMWRSSRVLKELLSTAWECGVQMVHSQEDQRDWLRENEGLSTRGSKTRLISHLQTRRPTRSRQGCWVYLVSLRKQPSNVCFMETPQPENQVTD